MSSYTLIDATDGAAFETVFSMITFVIAAVSFALAFISYFFAMQRVDRIHERFSTALAKIVSIDMLVDHGNGVFTPIEMPLTTAIEELLVREHNRQNTGARLVVIRKPEQQAQVQKLFSEDPSVQRPYSDKLADTD